MTAADTTPGEAPPTTLEQTRVRYALPVIERAAKDVASRFHRVTIDPKALYAEGTFALYREARLFRDEMSHDFADYAYRKVRDAMRDSLKVEHRADRRLRAGYKGADRFLAHRRDDEYNVLLHDEYDATVRLEEFVDELLVAAFAGVAEEQARIAAEDPVAAEEEYHCAVEALGTAFGRLSAEHARILVLVYRDDMDLDEASRAMDLSYRTAQRRHVEALAALRGELVTLGVCRAPPPLDVPEVGSFFPGAQPANEGGGEGAQP
jgi:RNA polymerase sigma factor (sigma-70 family)